jgi:hypothetical protein
MECARRVSWPVAFGLLTSAFGNVIEIVNLGRLLMVKRPATGS